MGESFILRNQIWNNGLPGEWSTKNLDKYKKKIEHKSFFSN
jgi:hypothetical protein